MKVLLEHGVDTVFGYPGGAALVIYDQLYNYRDKIKHILTAHEQGAAHAADGYARATGKTGVAFATSGPGATNLVTGIATAYMDSIPTVFITANVASHLIGKDSFQEICITGVTLPVTKKNYFINKKEDLAGALRNAFRIAREGRKGPVLVDITKDVTMEFVDYEPAEPFALKNVEITHLDMKTKEFAKDINNAKRPIVFVGGGVISSSASSQLQNLMIKADIPVVSSLMGLGCLSEEEENYFGLLGMHGSYAANKAVSEADLLLVIGSRFSDRVALNPKKFGGKAKILQIEIDRNEINKNVVVDDFIVGDCKEVLEKLLPLVKKGNHKEWIETIRQWNLNKPTKITKCNEELNPEQIIDYVCSKHDKEVVFVTDVGQHQMWAAQFVKQSLPRNFLTSGGLGTMGFGYGAAIGAQLGNPQKRVVHITGDGSLHMNLNEACTAVSQNLPIITLIFNNKALGMVYQWQSSFYDSRYSHTVTDRKTDFVKLIEAFGGNGFRATNIEEFKEAFEKSLKLNGPTWIDCDIAIHSKVMPMIPNGKTVADMLFE
jgi:acetolactate synthase-1/2/3 large subunit